MPLSTFHNLSPEDQGKILDACFREFALNDFDSASVSRIVRNLGIAKGSFYRYFRSKKELYYYLIDRATALRMEHVKELSTSSEDDLFARLERHFVMIIRFIIQFPLESGFLHNALGERNNETLGNIPLQTREMFIELLTPALEEYRKIGMVRSDIDMDILACTISQVQLGIMDFLSMRYHMDFRKNIKEGLSLFPIPEEEITDLAKALSRILRSGLGR